MPKHGVLLLGGYAKIGKTFLLLDMIDNLTIGGVLWGQKELAVKEPVPVVYIEQEIGELELQRRLRQRFDVLGRKPSDKFYYITEERALFLDTPSGRNRVLKLIEETKAKVVVVDPISRAMVGDEKDNHQVAQIFRYIQDLWSAHPDLAVVLSHHFGKPVKEEFKGDDYDEFSPYLFRGASKWFDAPDSLAVIHRDAALHPDKEWWRLKVGWTMRRAQAPENMKLAVTEGGLIMPATTGKMPKSIKKWEA